MALGLQSPAAHGDLCCQPIPLHLGIERLTGALFGQLPLGGLAFQDLLLPFDLFLLQFVPLPLGAKGQAKPGEFHRTIDKAL